MNISFSLPIIQTILASVLGVSAATGLLVHDTNIDKATVTALSSNVKNTSGPGADPHIHSERSSLYQATRDIRGTHPRVQPRTMKDREHVAAKRMNKGHHPFDNYNLPVID